MPHCQSNKTSYSLFPALQVKNSDLEGYPFVDVAGWPVSTSLWKILSPV